VTRAEGTPASAELQSQFAPRQSEMETRNKQSTSSGSVGGHQTTWSDEQNTKAHHQATYFRALEGRYRLQKINARSADVVDRSGGQMIGRVRGPLRTRENVLRRRCSIRLAQNSPKYLLLEQR